MRNENNGEAYNFIVMAPFEGLCGETGFVYQS